MSTQRSVGLIGDSNQTIRVRSPMTRSGVASSSSDTNRGVTPKRASTSCEQVQRAAVDRRAADDLVARLQVRHQDRRRRAHARREQQRRLGAVERRELLLRR